MATQALTSSVYSPFISGSTVGDAGHCLTRGMHFGQMLRGDPFVVGRYWSDVATPNDYTFMRFTLSSPYYTTAILLYQRADIQSFLA